MSWAFGNMSLLKRKQRALQKSHAAIVSKNRTVYENRPLRFFLQSCSKIVETSSKRARIHVFIFFISTDNILHK